jgi:hypothetical protein
MKTRKTIHEVSNTINMNQLDVINRQFFKMFSLPIWLAIFLSITLGFVTKPVRAENTGTEEIHRGYRYIKPKGVENTAKSASQGTKESSSAKDTGDKKTTSGAQDANVGGNYGSTGNVGQESKESSTETVKESGGQAPASGNQTTNTDQSSQIDRKIDPVSKAAESAGTLPTFAQSDKNGDHYVTKDELKDYPSLLQVFDKVDAGKDGKLEQHEFENLEMESKREGGIP